MAATDWIIPGGFVLGIAAYVTNFQGFKTWIDERIQTTTAEPGPGQYGEPGGSGGTVAEEEKDIINKLLNPTPPRKTTKPTTTPANAPLGKCFTYNGLTCWRNYKCGGGQVSLCGKASCDTVYKNWVVNYGCKKTPTPTLTAGQKCIQLAPSCKGSYNPCLCRCTETCKSIPNTHPQLKSDYSCSCIKNLLTIGQKCVQLAPSCAGVTNPCLCRCQGLCAKLPGTHPQLKSDGSCSCIKNLASYAHAYQAGNEALDTGLMQVPTLA